MTSRQQQRRARQRERSPDGSSSQPHVRRSSEGVTVHGLGTSDLALPSRGEKCVWRWVPVGSWFTSGVIAGTMVLGARCGLQVIVVLWSLRADDAGCRHALAILRLLRFSRVRR